MKFIALNYRETFNEPYVELNVTSRSEDWGKQLSPFILGPVLTLNGLARNVENAYQYSKVYEQHWDTVWGQPTPEYWSWRQKGFASTRAERYPMGKENKSKVVGLWIGRAGQSGSLLTYVEGRKELYVPAYLQALRASRLYPTFLKFVADAFHSDTNLVFRDFDVFNHHLTGETLEEIINDPGKKYGHGFILVEEALRFLNSQDEEFSNYELKLDGNEVDASTDGQVPLQIAHSSQTSSL